MGDTLEQLPTHLSEPELEAIERKLVRDGEHDSLNELFRNNEIIFTRKALQYQADLERPGSRKRLDAAEYIVANQAITFHEYLPRVLAHVKDTMSEYERLAGELDVLPPAIHAQEKPAAQYIAELERLVRERVSIGNAILREKNAAKKEELLVLSNQLNQQLIELLAGKTNIPGAPETFFPQQLLVDLISHRYSLLYEREVGLARQESTERPREKTAEERKQILQELVTLTEQLGEYHIAMEELTAIQHHFGQFFDTDPARESASGNTPEEIRQVIYANAEERKKFHSERISAFLNRLDEDVLSVGPREHVEDMWNVGGGRDFVRTLNDRVVSIITFPLPESLGIKEYVRSQLSGPLREAMGWPSDNVNASFDELPDEDKTKILNRARSILTHIRTFEAKKPVDPIRESLAVLNLMPPASEYLGTAPAQPLPQETVTQQNYENLIKQHGGATVYAMLFDQLNRQWGNTEPPSGFLGAYAELLEGFNQNVDVHIDVGAATLDLSRMWRDFMVYLFAAAGISFAAGLLMGSRMGRRLLASPFRLARRASSRTAQGALSRLRNTISRPPAGRTPVERLSNTFRSRGFGHAWRFASALLVGAEIVRRYRIQLNMERLPEQDGVAASLELMQLHPKINRDAERYEREVQSLIDRFELMEMQRVINQMIVGLSDADIPKAEQEAVNTLMREGGALVEAMQTQNRDLYRYFPITDYIYRSKVDPPNVLRVFYHQLNEARRRGQKEEKLGREKLSSWFHRKREAPQKIEDMQPILDENPELKAMLAEFAEVLQKEAAAIEAAGPYAQNAQRFEELRQGYEGWVGKVANM